MNAVLEVCHEKRAGTLQGRNQATSLKHTSPSDACMQSQTLDSSGYVLVLGVVVEDQFQVVVDVRLIVFQKAQPVAVLVEGL